MAFATHAEALVVLQQVSVPLSVEYDSNPYLDFNNVQSIWRYTAIPTYKISAVENQNKWYASAGVRLQRSSDKDISSDREDPAVLLGWERGDEKGGFSLVGHYNKNSTRTTEFTTTGLVNQDISSTTKSINADWKRELTERLHFVLDGQILKTTYESGGGFIDYLTKTIGTTLTYDFTEKLSSFARVDVTKYKADNEDNINSQNYLVGVNYAFSPQLDVSAGAGWNHIVSTGYALITKTSFNYHGEKHSFKGALGRSVTPTGIGNFQKSDNLSLGYGYLLSDKSKIGSELTWTKDYTLTSSETKRLYGFYSRDLSERWEMQLSLEYKQLKQFNQSANGEIAGLTFIYNTPEF